MSTGKIQRKRKVRFDEDMGDDDDDDDTRPRGFAEASDQPKAKKDKAEGKHTLDSDEEEQEEDEDRENRYALTEEDMHEELDTGFTDGGVEVTPFNLNKEMEEGRFDESGNYIEDKKANAGDEWLEGVAVYKGPQQAQMDDDDDGPASFDEQALKKELLKHMQPQESVSQALRRLGKEASKKAPCADPKKSEASLLAITEAADALLGGGAFDVYQFTYERIAFEVKEHEDKQATPPEDTGVMFEYKWSNDEGAETFGPFSASQMQAWREQGFLNDSVMCREIAKRNGPFYPITRIEFDLYD